MKVALACDHGGFALKAEIIETIKECGFEVIDCGCNSEEPVDYPDYADKVCKLVTDGEAKFGVLICGTGIGMSMAANKHKGIRCALLSDCFSAEMTRLHNDSNVMALGARVMGPGLAQMITKIYLTTEFSHAERHQNRIDKVNALM